MIGAMTSMWLHILWLDPSSASIFYHYEIENTIYKPKGQCPSVIIGTLNHVNKHEIFSSSCEAG
jgi:hypothetical protein